jgi:nucleotide-binding universal stress UspA family protein
VSLLIIGKRGVTPINELMLGSVAEYVVRESLTPVLLVP